MLYYNQTKTILHPPCYSSSTPKQLNCVAWRNELLLLNLAGSQAQSTEFIKQLSDYGDVDRKTTTSTSSLFRSKSDSRSSRPHVAVRPPSKDDRSSAAVVTRRERAASATGQSPAAGVPLTPAANKPVVVGGSIRFGGGRAAHGEMVRRPPLHRVR